MSLRDRHRIWGNQTLLLGLYLQLQYLEQILIVHLTQTYVGASAWDGTVFYHVPHSCTMSLWSCV